jgi:hypothetical protein
MQFSFNLRKTELNSVFLVNSIYNNTLIFGIIKFEKYT